MNKQTEALKMAIEALDTLMMEKGSIYQQALQACKKALEQPSIAELNNEYLRDTYVVGLKQPTQEPVAWISNDAQLPLKEDGSYWLYPEKVDEMLIPLYTHPAPSWQGLSDDEIQDIYEQHPNSPLYKGMAQVNEFARAIEQALKEKNT